MKYTLAESELRNVIRESIKTVLTENEPYWSGDINPKAIEGFREDVKKENIAKMKQQIEEYTDIIKNAALKGDAHKVGYYSKHLITVAKLLNDYNLENLRKEWQNTD